MEIAQGSLCFKFLSSATHLRSKSPQSNYSLQEKGKVKDSTQYEGREWEENRDFLSFDLVSKSNI